jgi:hypothetical protein
VWKERKAAGPGVGRSKARQAAAFLSCLSFEALNRLWLMRWALHCWARGVLAYRLHVRAFVRIDAPAGPRPEHHTAPAMAGPGDDFANAALTPGAAPQHV